MTNPKAGDRVRYPNGLMHCIEYVHESRGEVQVDSWELPIAELEYAGKHDRYNYSVFTHPGESL